MAKLAVRQTPVYYDVPKKKLKMPLKCCPDIIK